jgi:signal transduction histidine kinase
VVRDSGPGFPADFAQHAFDRFSRAETSRTTPGSGLGLYLVQSVAQAHGGTAEILQEPGGVVRLTVCTTPTRGLAPGSYDAH